MSDPRTRQKAVSDGVRWQLTPPKFSNPDFTVTGEKRARVEFRAYETVWFNTGTLCNIECPGCYIESSPKNDRLAYLSLAEVDAFLDEAERISPRPSQIGFTGGEPFMNPEFIAMLESTLVRGFRTLVLTNAMKPMQRSKRALLDLNVGHRAQLTVRVSLDHYSSDKHEKMRGARSWQSAIDGLIWLENNDFAVTVAGRSAWSESEESLRAGYADLFGKLGIRIPAHSPQALVLFPEMDEQADVPEITEHCWAILGKSPRDIMCSNSRMVIKRKGADRPTIVSCTLLPYLPEFEMGGTLREARGPVSLNHRHCARFCVLGGASCGAHG